MYIILEYNNNFLPALIIKYTSLPKANFIPEFYIIFGLYDPGPGFFKSGYSYFFP
jgi:hypothetical protein